MTAQRKRPQRQKKADRLTSRSATKVEIECDMAFAPFDREVRAMDLKWGVDRLVELMTPEVAKIWGTTMANLNAALDREEPAQVVECVHSALRGLAFMDAEATKAGHQPVSPEVWEADVDGFKFAVLRDGATWPALKQQRPDLRYFTMREIGIALRAINAGHPMIEAAKKIGGAEITGFKPKLTAAFFDAGGDELPF